MSEVSQGPGWWQASDLKWSPPQDPPNDAAPLPPPPQTRTSGSPSAPDSGRRQLSEAERTQILDNALTSRVRPVITIWDGRVRSSGPRISRSNTSAEIEWVTPVTHPAVIVMDAMLSVITCGLFGLYWFAKTLRKPQVQTVYIDEYGNQVWDNKEISPAQRVLSVVVGIALLIWFISVIHWFGSQPTD